MEIMRNTKHDELFVSHQGYIIHKLLEKFDMKIKLQASSPIANHFKLSSSQSSIIDVEENGGMVKIPYRGVIGSIICVFEGHYTIWFVVL